MVEAGAPGAHGGSVRVCEEQRESTYYPSRVEPILCIGNTALEEIMMEYVSKVKPTAGMWEHFGFKPNDHGIPQN